MLGWLDVQFCCQPESTTWIAERPMSEPLTNGRGVLCGETVGAAALDSV